MESNKDLKQSGFGSRFVRGRSCLAATPRGRLLRIRHGPFRPA
jgi:hypothetical protein